MAGSAPSPTLLPLFVKLAGRDVVVVGGGAMASIRVRQLAEAGARLTVVAPEVREEIAALAAVVLRRPFRPSDLDSAWYAVAAAPGPVNREVAAAAEERRILVNAVDDPDAATVYTGGVVRRGDVAVAISTGGRAPALAGLLREAIDAILPRDLATWVAAAERERPTWKRDRVPLATRRPLLLRKLDALYESDAPGDGELPPPPGLVSIVGAGPGDPGLLTRRAASRLAHADLVLYDALLDAEVLRLAPRAHCFYVGKRAGRPSVSQRAIERLLVRGARRGQRVVRLKCGDPFVLGRGGEEALALAAAGVPFEIVPGLSSALAAPALAGIPVTHRGLTAAFAVVSGHAEAAYGPVLDGLSPGSATVVVLMGLGRRAEIAARLAARGWDPETPAAIVLGASSPSAAVWRGALRELGAAPLPSDRADLPGVLVVGAVAALALNDAASRGAPGPRLTGADMPPESPLRSPPRARPSFADAREVDDFVETLRRFERGDLDAEAWRAYRVVRGAYSQRQDGAHMLRAKLPQGIATADQLRALADVAARHSRGFGHVTTRQNFQLHFLSPADLEPALRRLAEAGVTTAGAGGNAVRNVTACPLAGVAHGEVFDPTPYAEALTRHFLRHPLASALPRKFKIAVEGCAEDHVGAAIQDLGLRAVVRDEGGRPRRGFAVTVAGGTSTACTSAAPFLDFLPAGDLLALAEAIVRVFHARGDRKNKQRNRLKFLVRDLGLEPFRALVEAELGAVREIGRASCRERV